MGQRSQIYVRFPYKDGYGLIANYYQWNYGERMISRCRHALEYIHCANILDYLKFYFEQSSEYEHFRRYLDVNFDMKDIVMSHDIIKEYSEFGNGKFNEFVFHDQDNNDGKLLIDISKDGVKYAFLKQNADSSDIMDAEQYMDWDFEVDRYGNGWKNSVYIDVETCENNVYKIGTFASLMTKDEVDDFLNCKYQNEPKVKRS